MTVKIIRKVARIIPNTSRGPTILKNPKTINRIINNKNVKYIINQTKNAVNASTLKNALLKMLFIPIGR